MLNKQKLKYLLVLNFTWSILGIYADWQWLSLIPNYLIPFTAICSLYPPLLTLWYFLKLRGKNPPNWLTFWIACGTLSYGLMAQFYFPLLMSWKGLNFHDIASMFWVAVYGFQTLLLAKYLKPVKLLDLLFVTAFFTAANFSHYQLKTFVDLTLPGYPFWLACLTFILIVALQLFSLIFYFYKSKQAAVLNLQNNKILKF